jgi:hypothetical protein
VVGIVLGVHDGTEQGSLPVANPGRSSWKIEVK